MFHQGRNFRVKLMLSVVPQLGLRVSSHKRAQAIPGSVRTRAFDANRLTGTGSIIFSSAACVVAKLWNMDVSRRLLRSKTDTTNPTWFLPARAVAWMYWA